jgi:hypothetical protein
MAHSTALRRVSDIAQSVLGCFGLLTLVAASAYCQFVRIADEIGPAGVNTDGRQIWIQDLQGAARNSGLSVTSEWDDSNLLSRLLIQEPMRTTLRFKTTDVIDGLATSASQSLDQPASSATDGLGDRIPLRKDDTETRAAFVARLNELHVQTVADLLAALGFRRYEVYSVGQLIYWRDLPKIGQGNIRVAGMERK